MRTSLLLFAVLLPGVANARGRIELTQPNDVGTRLARQALPATGNTKLALSRTIYMNRNGVTLRPGDNNSSMNTSSVVTQPTVITPWDISDEMWADTMACMKNMYARFDVVITDKDPGMTPHIEAVFGGHPNDVDLPDEVMGVSPFTTDCAVIERSVVFTFTDVIEDDAQVMCEIMAQEIAHSYGLDHELLPEDPMTYLPYAGNRTFQNEMADCGEYGERMCGIDGSVCRERQNSVTLLTERLGRSASMMPDDDAAGSGSTKGGIVSGCSTSGSGAGFSFVLLLGHALLRRRSRDRRSGARP
jgi:uncharacterized protein (TIGR03382 family)